MRVFNQILCRRFAPIVGAAVVTLGILFRTTIAGAAVVTMDFTAAEGNNSGGFDTYPYDFTIDSVPGQLMCDDFAHEISPGDIWTARTLNIANLNSTNVAYLQYPSVGVTGYLEASYLFEEEVDAYTASNSDPEGLYNWAVWDLLSGSDVSGSYLNAGDEAQVQSYLSAAESAGSSLSASDFSEVIVYTPTDMSTDGPQEFFGYGTENAPVPEPCSLAVLGLGAVGLLTRRQRVPGILRVAGL